MRHVAVKLVEESIVTRKMIEQQKADARKRAKKANGKIPKAKLDEYKAKLVKLNEKIKKAKDLIKDLEHQKVALRKAYGVKVAKTSAPSDKPRARG